MNLVLGIVAVMLSAAFILAFARFTRGPSLPDRVVALDFMALLAIGVMATYSIATDQPAFLDVAIVLALISFLGTVAFAYYIEKGA